MPRMVWAVGLPPGSFPGCCCSDGRGCRSDGCLRRPGSMNGSNAQRTSPLVDGVSDRDVAWLRSGWLSSRSHDDNVGNDPMPADGPGSRSCPGEPTHLSCALCRHSSCCLRRRPRSQPTYPGFRSRPVGRRSTWQQHWRPWCRPRNCSSQLTVAAALTTRSSTSPNKSHRLCAFSHSAHCRALTQLAKHARRLHILFLARLYNSCRTLQIVRCKRSLTYICLLSRNFLRKPAKHVLLTCLTITWFFPQSCTDLSSGTQHLRTQWLPTRGVGKSITRPGWPAYSGNASNQSPRGPRGVRSQTIAALSNTLHLGPKQQNR